VEKGLLTLEDLIDCTKEQFRNIVLSVLKWNEGRFQFVDESPPDTLLNLDINILNFVFTYITQNLDAKQINKQLGSLELKLSGNKDTEKLNKYHLNEKQKVLLNRFNGVTPINQILTAYPEEHRDSILKIIYFFFLSELILKVESKTEPKKIMKDDQDRQVYVGAKDTPKKDAFVFGKKPRAKSEEVPPKSPAPFYIPEKRVNDKKKSKQFSYLIIFIILIFILGGIIFILLMDDETPDKGLSTPTGEEIQTVTEKETKTSTDKEPPIVVPMQKQEPDQKEADIDPEKPAEKKPEPEAVSTQQAAEKPETRTDDQSVIESEPVKTAAAYFKEGDFYKACNAWKGEIKSSGVTHSILLELDCQKESVLNAYNRVDRKDQFFILKRDVGNRICYLVFWGRFMSGQEAADALNRVDSYFWGQANPPKVMSLNQYL
jgi:hypothetical protein